MLKEQKIIKNLRKKTIKLNIKFPPHFIKVKSIYVSFMFFLVLLHVIHTCTQGGLEHRYCVLQHPRSNHYTNVTPLPPTTIGVVPF